MENPCSRRNPMSRVIRFVLAVVLGGLTGHVRLHADQAPAQVHENPYPDVDIAYGQQIYATRCSVCHGPQGDAVGGVALRSGKFRNAVIDRDLERFIRSGSQAAGMPPFALNAAEMTGVIAYLRNMNTFDAAA